MHADDTAAGPGGQDPARDAAAEEELRQRLEEQMRQLRVPDLLLESAVSILNLSARRIMKEDERDLEQARIGIEAVRAVIDLIDEGPRAQVREALSQVQMLYARQAQGGAPAGAEPASAGREAAGGRTEQPGAESARGPDRPPPGLWVPPGSS